MNNIQPVRVRFAPSPTGYLHVGGARTALFNWLYARKLGGTFILRIEDTDFERSTREMVEGILVAMRWLGLDWDEGPFYQSQRLEKYRATAEKLLASGHAYYCFCTKEQLEHRRANAQAEGRPLQYERLCRRLEKAEVARRRTAGEAAAVRFAVPETGSTIIDDAVFGPVEFAHSEIEDFVLLRSDGVPTYHLSVVTDDLDMGITHIIRGADHLSNTPKQILQYQALGRPLPVFAHVPLILGPDKTRLSKRHGATSVTAYKEEGFLPEAFRNFLALLGWTPPDSTREVMTDAAMISQFSLEGISRSDAVFDRAKLEWFNGEYIRAMSPVDLAARLLPVVRAAGYEIDENKMRQIASLVRERITLLNDVLTVADFFFLQHLPPYDPALLIPQKGDIALAKKILELARKYLSGDRLAGANFTAQHIEHALRNAAQELQIKPGQMFSPVRVAVTGRNQAPPLFETLEVLGREVVLVRISKALERADET